MNVRQSQRNRQEMRREFIQRHERKQNPSPPATRETRQKQTERGKENSRTAQQHKSVQERQSEKMKSEEK